MRVITGKVKGAKLSTIEGLETRPTLDRIKETMFNLITNDFEGAECLDVFSGSGALGIEALSRGAKHCIFVDSNPECIDVIDKNLCKLRLNEFADVINSDVLKVIESYKDIKKFDMVYMDPPYDKGYVNAVISKIVECNILKKSGIIIVEASPHEKIENELVKILKERNYKKMSIYILVVN